MKEPPVEKPVKAAPKTPEIPKIVTTESAKAKSTIQLPKFGDLKGGIKTETQNASKPAEKEDESFTEDQLRATWKQFAETRKIYQAEYHLLSQEIEIRNGKQVIVHLHNHFQETLINTIKVDILTFLREKLNNNSIQLTGELKSTDEKKMIYTNREKFEHLAEKNPKLKELKERFGLDTDF